MKKLLLSAVLIGFLAGCGSTDTKDEGAPVEDRTAAVKPGPSGPTTGKPADTGVSGKPLDSSRDPTKDPKNILSQRSVFFDYDSFVVKDEFRPVVTAHARYLSDNRGRKIVIQGNTDERGSREYNIALGQKRADAVRRMMQVLGVQESQIETVSFGKEKPRNPGHDEAAWAQNRRADIVYEGE
jgi:peptidoglycan-associated lipoprotein